MLDMVVNANDYETFPQKECEWVLKYNALHCADLVASDTDCQVEMHTTEGAASGVCLKNLLKIRSK